MFFLKEFQWLARYWAPDCSHSHIMRPGGILIILIILLVHFTPTTRQKTLKFLRENARFDHKTFKLLWENTRFDENPLNS